MDEVNFTAKYMDDAYKKAAEIILASESAVAMTGAGISVASGIPPFRGKGGIWEKYDPYVYASIEVFERDPSKYWSIRGPFVREIDKYRPNPGHLALAELEAMGLLSAIITQNIDGLHQLAGSRNVIELHGNTREIRCVQCGREYTAPHIPDGTPPICECGGVLKPNTVLFGEQLPLDAMLAAQDAIESCDAMLVVGTSALVVPAVSFAYAASEKGARILEYNLEQTFPSPDVGLYGLSELTLKATLDAVIELRK